MLSGEKVVHKFIDENPDWSVLGNSLIREIEFDNFSEALAFVVRLGLLAEQSDHHPDIKLHSWNKVSLNLSTHSEGGITDKDLNLAQAISKIR